MHNRPRDLAPDVHIGLDLDLVAGRFSRAIDAKDAADPREATKGIGGLPIAFSLTSGTIQRNAEDLGLGAGGNRVFSGFCRDSFVEGSGCFEGDTNIACPVAGDLNGVPCSSDADCSAPYESCAQRTAGGFSRAASTQINLFGQTDGGCLGDGATHTADLVSVFDIPPTFDAVVDAAGDLPGPGAAMIRGEAQLEP